MEEQIRNNKDYIPNNLPVTTEELEEKLIKEEQIILEKMEEQIRNNKDYIPNKLPVTTEELEEKLIKG